MNLKSLLAKPFANYIYSKTRKGMHTAIHDQEEILKMLIKTGKSTIFGKDHQLEAVEGYASFKEAIPIRDYEQLKPYITMVKEGKQNVLWKGKPIYLPKQAALPAALNTFPSPKIPSLTILIPPEMPCYVI